MFFNSSQTFSTAPKFEYINSKLMNKPFGCSKCNKSFSQRHHLIYHMHVHDGTKPYVCKVCNKSFRVIYFLNAHRKTSGH